MLNRLGSAKIVTALLAVLAVGLAAGFVYDDDAAAARKPPLNTLWAVVEPGGTLQHGKGVTSSEKLGTGAYRITFNRNISNCAAVATISDGFIGEIGTLIKRPPLTSPEVSVYTRDSAGNVQDQSFNLLVRC
jgi:hypothetical protein